MNPLTINLVVAYGIILFFLVQGVSYYKKINSFEKFFLFGRALESKEYSRSFAAASTSLATVLFFFVTLGLQHGIYILFSPLTYILGCYLYYKFILPPLEVQGFFTENNINKNSLGTTLGNYIKQRYESSSIKYSVIFVTFLGLLSILLIELYVGVTIFSIYLKEQYIDFALIFIAFIVFIYTSFGGLVAVVKTDKLQYKVILFSSIIFLGWLVYEARTTGRMPSYSDYIVSSPILKNGFLLPYPIFFNILIVNILLLPSLLRTWQLAAASPNAESVKKGLKSGVLLTTVLTVSFILIGIFFFKSVFPSAEISLVGILNALANSDSFFGAYIIFPLFFGSCLAALLSTADSALIPILQSFSLDFTKVENPKWNHKKILFLTFILLLVTVVLYMVVFRWLKFNLINWLFTIFSFLIICTPSILMAILLPKNILIKKSTKIITLISIWGGLFIAIMLSVIGNRLNIIEIVQLNCPLASIFGFLCYLFVLIFNKKKNKSIGVKS